MIARPKRKSRVETQPSVTMYLHHVNIPNPNRVVASSLSQKWNHHRTSAENDGAFTSLAFFRTWFILAASTGEIEVGEQVETSLVNIGCST